MYIERDAPSVMTITIPQSCLFTNSLFKKLQVVMFDMSVLTCNDIVSMIK